MQNQEEQYYINRLQLVISYPAMFVPTLSDDDLRSILIEIVVGYFEGEVSFEAVLAVGENLHIFKGMRERSLQNQRIDSLIFQITELAAYKKDPHSAEEKIANVLGNVLDELV